MNGTRLFPEGEVPTVARYLTPGGAHVVVSGAVADSTLVVACEGCGQCGGPYYQGIGDDTPERGFRDAKRDAQRHAETCRAVPERLWPENGALRPE